MKLSRRKYDKLLANIGAAIDIARTNSIATINAQLVKANWEIGRYIVEFEQQGNERAEYGSDLLARRSINCIYPTQQHSKKKLEN